MNVYDSKPPGTPSQAQMLTRYKAWATDIAFQGVMALPHEEVTKERPTTFKTMLSTLNHIYVVDDIFKAHLEGRTHGYSKRNTDEQPALEDLWRACQAMDRWYVELADRLSETELAEVISFEFVGGGAGRMSRNDILLHVVNHGTYHHGFVSDMMYQVPARPAANDLPVFLRDVWYRA